MANKFVTRFPQYFNIFIEFSDYFINHKMMLILQHDAAALRLANVHVQV